MKSNLQEERWQRESYSTPCGGRGQLTYRCAVRARLFFDVVESRQGGPAEPTDGKNVTNVAPIFSWQARFPENETGQMREPCHEWGLSRKESCTVFDVKVHRRPGVGQSSTSKGPKSEDQVLKLFVEKKFHDR